MDATPRRSDDARSASSTLRPDRGSLGGCDRWEAERWGREDEAALDRWADEAGECVFPETELAVAVGPGPRGRRELGTRNRPASAQRVAARRGEEDAGAAGESP